MVDKRGILWSRIKNYDIDDMDSELKFSQRLQRENLGWSYDYTLRVIDEYKRFIYLGIISGHPVTPSEEVDQCWHLHMIYTRQYWDDFCEDVLGGIKFHHGPTKGGKKEADKFVDYYTKTRESYNKFFEEDWPQDIWPDNNSRFKPVDFKRVDLTNHWVVPIGDWKAMLKILINTIRQKS